VRCGSIDTTLLWEHRDQLWAEAYTKYRAGMVWYLDSAELNAMAKDEQDKRYEPGVWDDVILEWIESPRQRMERSGAMGEALPMPEFHSRSGCVTVLDVLVHCIGKSMEKINRADQMNVSKCLTHAGWKRARGPRGSGSRRWFYQKPEGYLA
jgi:predicted P-loop ATPase